MNRRTFLGSALCPALAAPGRPEITGVPFLGVYAKDPAQSRPYYSEFLGFEQAYEFAAAGAEPATSLFKINDRQFVKLYPETQAATDRLHHIALETNNAEAMRSYLHSRGIEVPAGVGTDRLGSSTFFLRDPEGHSVEIVQYRSGSRVVRDKGKTLGINRISNRMMHVGIIVTRLEPELKFYTEVLGFKEFWRGSSTGTQLSWINLKVPDGEDYIELMLYKDAPPPTSRGGAHHLCLEVPSVPEAAAVLEKRKAAAGYTRTIEPRVGRNRRRQVNLYDPDGTRAELMEPVTVDGVPAESSTAPPPQ